LLAPGREKQKKKNQFMIERVERSQDNETTYFLKGNPGAQGCNKACPIHLASF
jgi:hypothetical protein